MIVRRVVPALAAVAALSTSAIAADSTVTIGGWSDNILGVVNADWQHDVNGTARDDGATTVGFSTNAGLRLGWTVTPRLHAKVNAWLVNEAGLYGIFGAGAYLGNASNYGNARDTSIALRESFVRYDLSDNLSWTLGKYENHLGWIAVEPDGLYRVNPSTIGYVSTLYGNDVVGTALAYRSSSMPLSGSLHITNGYFTPGDSYNTNASGTGHPSSSRENYDLGYGLDLIWGFGKEQAKRSNVNLEFAFDPHGGNNAAASSDRAGDAFQAGLNVTVRRGDLGDFSKDLVLGGEVIWRESKTAQTQAASGAITNVADTHGEDFGWMLLGNYGIGSGSTVHWLSVPASLTLSFQQFTTNWRQPGERESDATEVAVALLTNPLQDANFGLNVELAYDTYQTNNPNRPSTQNPFGGTDTAWIGSLEAIAIIP